MPMHFAPARLCALAFILSHIHQERVPILAVYPHKYREQPTDGQPMRLLLAFSSRTKYGLYRSRPGSLER